MILSFLSWYLLSTLLGLLGLPLCFGLFRRLPGKGFAFARPFGLLAVGYLAWLLGSLGLLRNDGMGLVFASGLVLLAGLGWLRKEGVQALFGWLKEEWKVCLGLELVFLAGFIGWTLVRAANPEILGTEKPMELMFLNSILKSPSLPPQDAWLSGHSISYYYFGYYLVAVLTRLAGTPAAVAFNLALGLWFGMAASGAMGVVLELSALTRGSRLSLLRVFFPALLAPLLLLLTGNLYGALGLAHANGLGANLRLPAIYYDFGETSENGKDFERFPGAKAGWVNAWEWLDLKQINQPPGVKPETPELGLDKWFFAARVVHDRGLAGAEVEAIDENPAFSFLLGDLHPHVLALPYVLLASILALEAVLWGVDGLPFDRQAAWRMVLMGVVLGSLLAINTWDFPIYFFLIATATCLGALKSPSWAGWKSALPRLGAALGLLLGISLLLYLPFFVSLQSQAAGILPNVLYPTRVQQLFVMFAPLLAAVFCLVLWLARREKKAFNWHVAVWAALGLLAGLAALAGLLSFIALQIGPAQAYIQQILAPFNLKDALNLIAQRRLVDGWSGLLMAGLVGLCTALLFSKSLRKPALILGVLMSLTGGLLVLGPEYLYLRDNFGTRMNTLFKFYFQAWVLWSLAGAFGIGTLWHFGGRRTRLALSLGVGLPVLLGCLYLPAGLWSKTGGFNKPFSLDGMAYFAQQYPDDWAAVQWLNEHADPGSVILEGTRGAYWAEGRSSRISMATGLPTLLGWVNHEAQWRGAYYSQVAGREEDIRTIYTSTDWAKTRQLLDSYGVDLILISDLEREIYQPLREAKFEQNLKPVFQSGNLVIYQVR